MPAILSPSPARPSPVLAAPADEPTKSRRALGSTPTPSPAPRPRSPCSRRRLKPYSTRRRTSQRAPRPSEPLPIHPFDQLPWIAALDATPSDLWDIADLSQIPVPDPRSACRSPKMMSRRPPPDLIQTPPPPPPPSCDTPASQRAAMISRPTTPLSRFIPSRVLFHNLMPVLCESPNDDPCTSSSPLQPSFFHLLSPRLN